MANEGDILYLIGRLERFPEVRNNNFLYEHGYAEEDMFLRAIAERGFEYGYDLSGLDLTRVPHPNREGVFVDLMPALNAFILPRLNLRGAKLTYVPTERVGEDVNEDERYVLPTITFHEGADLTQAEIAVDAPEDVQKNLNVQFLFATSVYPPAASKRKRVEGDEKREFCTIIADRLRLPPEYRSVHMQVNCPVDFTTEDLKEYATPATTDPEGRAVKYTAQYIQCDPYAGEQPNTATFKNHVFIHYSQDTIMRGCRFLPGTIIHLEQPSYLKKEDPLPLLDLDFAALAGAQIRHTPKRSGTNDELVTPRFRISMQYAHARNLVVSGSARGAEWSGSIAGGDFESARFNNIDFQNMSVDSANLAATVFNTCSVTGFTHLRAEQLVSTYFDGTTLPGIPEEVQARLARIRDNRNIMVLTPKLEEYILAEYMPTIVPSDKNPACFDTLLDKLDRLPEIALKDDDRRTQEERIIYMTLEPLFGHDELALRDWLKFLREYPLHFLKELTGDEDKARIAELSPRMEVLSGIHNLLVAGHAMKVAEARERYGDNFKTMLGLE